MKWTQKLAAKILPTITRIIHNRNQDPPAQAHMLDVDAVHGALRRAEAGDCSELFGIYRDIIAGHSHIQGEFSKRKMAVLNEPLTLTPDDPDDEVQAAFISDVQDHINALPNLIHVLSHLLDSSLYPVSVAEKLYRQSFKPGWRYELSEINNLPHTHLIWPDDGTMSKRHTTEDGHFTGSHSPILARDYIIHRAHLLSSVPDWWGGPMRALLFWYLFSIMDRDWWARFLDRYGSPFIVGKYDKADDQSRYELEQAFSFATKVGGLVTTNEAQVELIQANTGAGGDAFEKFHSTANREFSKLIVGQTLSAEGQNLGLGGGQASAQEGVRDDIRKFDANMLAHTFQTQILAPLWSANAWTHPIPTVTWGIDTEEASDTGKTVSEISSSGLEPTDEGLAIIGKRVGFPVQRIKSPTLNLSALSADPEKLALIPTAERRMERKRQARRATAAVIAAASPQLASTLRRRGDEIIEAIELSASPEEAANAIARITAEYDPAAAAEIIQNTLMACSSNAILAIDN